MHGLLSFAPQSEEELEYAFVIRRYDRDNKGLPVHQEQLDGAMQIMDKYGKRGMITNNMSAMKRWPDF